MEMKKVYIFDAYGTLFDVDASCRNFSEKLGNNWHRLSTVWRQKQLEYSWLRNSMKSFTSFWNITENALDFALHSMKIHNTSLRQDLLDSYFNIECYPEVYSFLEALKRVNTSSCILSNGSYDMLNAAIKNSGLRDYVDGVLSVDLCKKFKPALEVYQLVLNEYPKNEHEFLFFSSNCWDIHGASNFGFKSVWVNRFNRVNDILPGNPDYIVKSLMDFQANHL
tara:strand:+ start:64 stop:732 length:669 start_codon:yes stop_codon:yes gene_type:complete